MTRRSFVEGYPFDCALLSEIKKLGKPVVTVLIIGRPIVLDEVREKSDAVDVEYVVEPGDFKVAVWDRFTPSFATDRQVTYTVK